MIVLCDNPECGAVLRAAATYSPTQTVLKREGDHEFFDCPRCGRRTTIATRGGAGAPPHTTREGAGAPPHPSTRPNP